MDIKNILIIATLLLSGCNPSNSAASADTEILGEACKALGNAEKTQAMLVRSGTDPRRVKVAPLKQSSPLGLKRLAN